MKLIEAIEHAVNLTLEIQKALDRDDTAGALELLPVRSLAMDRFQNEHSKASPAELRDCASGLQELMTLDAALQSEAGRQLMSAAESLHTSQAPTHKRADPTPCLSGCLDRHA